MLGFKGNKQALCRPFGEKMGEGRGFGGMGVSVSHWGEWLCVCIGKVPGSSGQASAMAVGSFYGCLCDLFGDTVKDQKVRRVNGIIAKVVTTKDKAHSLVSWSYGNS